MGKRAPKQNEKSPRRAKAAPVATAPTAAREARTAGVHDAALTLFSRFGYHGTSMKDIAEAVHMRAPSLYNHVAAKQDLLREILFGVHEASDREMNAALASSDDVVEQLRRAIEVHVRFHTRHRREINVAARDLEHLEEPARSQISRMRRTFEERMIALIQKGMDEGRFHVTSPKLTAYAILRMGAGVGRWYRPSGEFSDSEIAFTYGDLALRMVGIPPAQTKTAGKIAKNGGTARRA